MNQKKDLKKTNIWIYAGIIKGLFIFLIISILIPYSRGLVVKTNDLILSFVMWMSIGIIFGFINRYIARRRIKNV